MTSHIRYFTNHGISEDDIGFLYADNADDVHFSETLVKKKATVIESLETKECLPANVRILFTTSKGKEGININDKDIPAMYCESHYVADLVQMAGRVRNGLRTLYIIRDAAQTCDYLSNFTADINRNCVEAVNQTYQNYLNNYCTYLLHRRSTLIAYIRCTCCSCRRAFFSSRQRMVFSWSLRPRPITRALRIVMGDT